MLSGHGPQWHQVGFLQQADVGSGQGTPLRVVGGAAVRQTQTDVRPPPPGGGRAQATGSQHPPRGLRPSSEGGGSTLRSEIGETGSKVLVVKMTKINTNIEWQKRKSLKGYFQRVCFLKHMILSFGKTERPAPVESLVTGCRGQQTPASCSQPRCQSWSVNLCSGGPRTLGSLGVGRAESYMDFIPLAVVFSDSPSPTAATSWRPE